MAKGMLIDGQMVDSDRHFDVVDPALGTPFASVPAATAAHLEQAVAAAERAQPGWAASIDTRRAVLRACADLIRAHAQELGGLICREQGKPLASAIGETMGTARWFEYTAGLPHADEIVRDDDMMRVIVRQRPFGIVAGIAPWNYPLMTIAWKIAPALLAGNCIIVKSSPFTPVATQRLGEILKDAVPRGVLALLSGGDDIGRMLASHPAVRKVSLTGSVEAGKSVFTAAADDMKRLTLELGGNDAAIVLDDVDPGKVVEKLFWGAFQNAGQVCSAIKRLYVQDAVYDAVVSGFTARLARTIMGNGLVAGVEMGPISTLPQLDRVRELAASVEQDGGRLISGGVTPNQPGGFFLAPGIALGLADDARLVVEEQFGPILPILRFTDPDDAVRRANASHFGLSGSVWSADADRAARHAGELDCGTSWVNQHLSVMPEAPVGGHKWSGLGVENGPWGLAAYSQIQTLSAAKG